MKPSTPRRDLRSRLDHLEAETSGPAVMVLCMDGQPSPQQQQHIDDAKRRGTTVVIMSEGDRQL